MSSIPNVKHLTEAMTKYYFLFETCSQCIRHLPKKSQEYKDAVEKWKTRSEFYRPRNEDAKAAFISAVNKACDIPSRTPEDCFLIIFACSAALQVFVNDDLLKLSESDRFQVMRDSRRISLEQIKAHTAAHHPATTTSLPPHLRSVLYPRQDPDDRDNLIGQRIRYRDQTSGEIKEFVVCDYVTSRMKGAHFLVSYDDTAEDEVIKEDDMEEILRNPLE